MGLCLKIQHKKNVYIIDRTRVNGKDSIVSVKKLGILGKDITKREANKILNEMKYNPERLTERVNKTITFNQLHDEFEPYYLNKVKRGDMPRSTFNVYLESMVRVRPFLFNKSVSEVDEFLIESLITYLANRNLKKTTIRITITDIRRLLNYAYKKKYIKTIPEINISMKAEEKTPQIFTDLEIKTLYDNSSENLKFCITVLLNTGLRAFEFSILRVKDVHEDFINVRGVNSIGQKNNKKRGRKIPINKELYSLINQSILDNNLKDDDIISPYSETSYLRKSLIRVAKKTNLDCSCAITKFRATFATRLAKSGASVLALTSLMGHTSPNTTMKYYLNINTTDNYLLEHINKASSFI
tara:strand:- start:1949 stop:3016 length:1068 start_codon:yes stop_codon:yes gene_type:complete